MANEIFGVDLFFSTDLQVSVGSHPGEARALLHHVKTAPLMTDGNRCKKYTADFHEEFNTKVEIITINFLNVSYIIANLYFLRSDPLYVTKL